MNKINPLLEAFQQTNFPVGGHGKRNIQVLIDALQDVDGQTDGDTYGNGKLIEDFQEEMAAFLGKESAVFFPSGTMAQQIALRIWCDHKGIKKVAYHPLSHLEIHEEDGLKELHHIQPILLGEKDRLIRLEDVLHIKEDIACLLLELPQREIGGQLPDYEELVQISAYCRSHGIKLHLDGARLYEILPYYQKSAREICELFDSVYISFYKGIGGIAGALLAGDETFTKQSKVWKRRHGGDLISLYPYILSASHYFKQRLNKMGQYYEEAIELAALYNQVPGVATTPSKPVTNMFHVHINRPKEQMESLLVNLYEATGVGLTHYLKEINETSCCYEVSIGDRYANVPKEELRKAFAWMESHLIENGV
ncbi:aminotransferase class I/II-fold pyridoxal phosphate-dependent enzyme [Paenibacillus sp. 5J-6]|uniref:Aminotransferase class I/II-fold pyridoxal phosphate-dependent enzyme n=1 Tax=Paenibacillus silvestris TaxID=2606219 RepID=A0A6L8V6N1_9BACL|nr:aminotransferase class I/II-fold pyridoxal phosphate-dependent enzyme [Paenibacillus silvestris]MZQ85271.1 aminotransferase class I/II-fold pyridoxal phosphate-dependent enzyme [Paenibacillus silvestris]